MRRFAPLVLLVGLAVACTVSEDDEAAGTSAVPADATTAEPGAAVRGVTDDEITVGVVLVDYAGINDTFGVDLNTADAQPAYDAAIAELNERGGILGRQVVPNYERYLPVRVTDIEAACLALTEDTESFIVTGGIRPQEGSLCFTRLHEVPFISSFGMPGEVIDESVAPVVALELESTRALRGIIEGLDERGVLADHTVGVFAHAGEEANIAVIEEELAARGLPAPVVGVNDTAESDQVAYEQNSDLIMELFDSEGVSLVIPLGASPAAAYVALDRNNLEQVVIATNNGQMNGETVFVESGVDPDRRAGSYFLGTRDFADLYDDDHQPTVDCVENYEARSGDTANLRPDENPEVLGNIGGVMRSCQALALLEAALVGEGAVNDAALAAGLNAIDGLEIAGADPGSLRPDKRDFPDVVYLKEYDTGGGDWIDGEPLALG